MKRLLSLALVLLLLITGICPLSSCGAVSTAAAIRKADQALTEAPYVMTMSMKFDCSGTELDPLFNALNVELPITVDGSNMAFSMKTPVAQGINARINATLVDKVLYYDVSVLGQNTKMKTTLNDEQYRNFMAESSTQMPISPSAFETMTLEEVDGKKVISCSGITSEGMEDLNKIVEDALTSVNTEVTMDDLSFTMTIADDKYESAVLNLTYSITFVGKLYTLSVTIHAAYAYEDAEPVTAPEDADRYMEFDYEDMVG